MIGLMDVNNFFVSCERLFRPDLTTKPVAVLSSNDGCIVARSNEVKAMGVPMGIPLFQAKQLVDMSQVTLFSSNFTLYRDISRRVMEVLIEEVGECEQYSIDESFFVVPAATTVTELATIRATVMRKTGIPVSIGVAPTKTLAKVAAGIAKRTTGSTYLTLLEWQAIAGETTTGDIWNLGGATERKLREQNVTTAREYMQLDRAWIATQFGVSGCRLYDELHGDIAHAVQTNSADLRKSLTSSRSFASTTSVLSDLKSAVAYHVEQIAQKLRQQNLLATRMYVSMGASRHSDFAYRRGSIEIVLDRPSNETRYLLQRTTRACEAHFEPGVPYKKAGVVAAGLIVPEFVQGDLFTAPDSTSDTTTLDTITDQLNRRYGAGVIRSGAIQASGSRTSALLRSKSYTTAWNDIPSVIA